MKRLLLFSCLIISSLCSDAQSALKLPVLSSNAKLIQDFSVSNIEITYSRPSMRGRKIFGLGDFVCPYGKVWRTGANAPTKIKLGEELEIGGFKVKAGEYALYTIPGKERWEIILNTGTTNWGADGYTKENDVARFSIKPSLLDENVQTFTINISDITFNTCKIELEWERTKITIPVVAHNEETVDLNIDKAINHPQPLPYFQAANYYLESDKKLDVAKAYIDKAVDQDPKAFYAWLLKAKIEKKLGNDEAAVVAAKKSMEMAKGNANEAEYIRNNTRIIEEIKKRHHKQTIE